MRPGKANLKYLHAIKEIRDKDPDLFEKIKRLPKKARTAKYHTEQANSLITYFRRGKLQKFFLADADPDAEELDFIVGGKATGKQSSMKQEKTAGAVLRPAG